MTQPLKGKSPFYPGQPVPVELFVGRASEIDHIMTRGAAQVAAGKPISIFIQGEYGIGKSSIAAVLLRTAEREHGLHGIYAPLGAAETLDDVGAAVLEATLKSGAFEPTRSERVRSWLGRFIGEQSLFGITVHAEALRQEAPSVTRDLLSFLREAIRRLGDTGVRGVCLVLDEINGITSQASFAHFMKGFVDANAMSRDPVPVLLMLCGVEERRREMIRKHPPVDRLFDVVEISPMSPDERRAFFERAFRTAGMSVEPTALELMSEYSAGYPKIMHLIGDAAYWSDQDGHISDDDARNAVITAADDVGRKYVDQQVYAALRSDDYRSILDKIAELPASQLSFDRRQVSNGLTESEPKKFNNFLQEMKKLRVLQAGETQGEYVFTSRMVRLYVWLRRHRSKRERP